MAFLPMELRSARDLLVLTATCSLAAQESQKNPLVGAMAIEEQERRAGPNQRAWIGREPQLYQSSLQRAIFWDQ